MGAYNNFLESVKSAMIGLVPYGGTIVPTSNEFSTTIAQYVKGGYMPLPDLETLADLPIELMLKDMTVVVSEHERPNGSLHTRTRYYLKVVPSDRISTLGDNISLYWSVEEVSTAETSSDVTVEYAPNFQGKRPRFLPTEISSDAYQAGYPTDDLFDSGNPSDIIWVADYDATKGHAWIRQRIGTQPWGIPVSLAAGGDYEQNQYIDVIFRWVTKASGRPDKPVQPDNYNELPAGWDNTPGTDYDTRILTEDLYRSEALRNPYGVLKSDWTLPILVSSDPLLVRYGNTPGSTDFLNNIYWRGYYTPGLDTHMATRATTLSSEWTIIKIDKENGEYTDFVFKLLPIGATTQDIIDATPTLPIPIGGAVPNDWSDGPVAVSDSTTVQYVSKSVKFSDGSFKTPWSVPRRFDGLDAINLIIENSPGDTFYKIRDVNGVLVDAFDDIVLTPKLYKGITELTTGINTVKWYRGATLIVFDGVTRKALNLGISLNAYHEISVDGLSLTINPSAVDTTQQYKVGLNHATRPDADYEQTIQILDATDDGSSFLADILSSNGTTFKNQTGLYPFVAKFFKGGVLDLTNVVFKWSIVDSIGNPITDGLKNNLGVTIGDIDVIASTVYVRGADIDQYGVLILTATFGEVVRTHRVTLTDVQDAEGIDVLYWGTGLTDPGNPTDFSPRTLTAQEVLDLAIGYLLPEDGAGAWYRIEKVNGVWGAELKVRAEASNPNGGLNVIIWKNETDPTVPSTPTVPGAGSIIPAGWSVAPTDFVSTENATYITSCLFLLRTDVVADAAVLTRANYTPVGTYGTPKKIQSPNPGGGIDGTNGWSPYIATIVDGTRVVLWLADWIGGTGSKPAGSGGANSYIGASGLTTKALATDVRGPQGNNTYVPASFYSQGVKNVAATITSAVGTEVTLQSINIPNNSHKLLIVKGSVKVLSDSTSDDDVFRVRLRDSNIIGDIAYEDVRPMISAPYQGVKCEVSFVQEVVPGGPNGTRTYSITIEQLTGGLAKRDAGYLEVLVLPI